MFFIVINCLTELIIVRQSTGPLLDPDTEVLDVSKYSLKLAEDTVFINLKIINLSLFQAAFCLGRCL